MSLESLYKLSILVNMIDRVSGPAAKINSTIKNTTEGFNKYSVKMANMARDGVVLMGTGYQIANAAMAPVKATFETQDALAELSSLGIEKLGALENAATRFSSTWAGTTKPQFLTAAYDIKSGIASLNDEGVAGYTNIAGVTAKATKATINQMTDLFATGYGIYKDYYSELSDMQFGEIFSAGIASSVRLFKTTGSGMAQAISALGGSATAARVPLEEQLSILGMLQATMSGSEAGTKYTAFLNNAARAGGELGLNFTDINGQLKSMPEILGQIHGKFGDVLTAGNKLELQKAFGTVEAVKLIDLLYSKTGDLQVNIVDLYDTMGKGISVAEEMANKINAPPAQGWILFQQKLQTTAETVGNAMLPTFMELQEKIDGAANKLMVFTNKHPQLISNIMYLVATFGVFLITLGGSKFIFGGLGAIFTGLYKFAGIAVKGFKALQYGIFLVQYGAFLLKPALLALKGGFLSAASAAWAFIAPLLANPITWIVIAVIALIAGLVLLYNKCEWFRNGVNAVWDGIKSGASSALGFIKGIFGNMQSAFVEHGGGLEGAVFATFEAVKGLFIAGFNFLDYLSGGKLSVISENIKAFLSNPLESIKMAWDSLPQWFTGFFDNLGTLFGMSGQKIVQTLVDGIMSMMLAPYNAVKSIFGLVRQLLPFSDAKEGPLSELTLSGRRIFETINTGMEQSAGLPARTVDKAFSEADGNIAATVSGKTATGVETGTGKTTVIQQLILKVGLDDVDSLKKLKKLIQEIEDEVNGDNPNPEPQPVF